MSTTFKVQRSITSPANYLAIRNGEEYKLINCETGGVIQCKSSQEVWDHVEGIVGCKVEWQNDHREEPKPFRISDFLKKIRSKWIFSYGKR